MSVAVEEEEAEAKSTEEEWDKERKVLEWPRPVVVGDLEELCWVGFSFRWWVVRCHGEGMVGGEEEKT